MAWPVFDFEYDVSWVWQMHMVICPLLLHFLEWFYYIECPSWFVHSPHFISFIFLNYVITKSCLIISMNKYTNLLENIIHRISYYSPVNLSINGACMSVISHYQWTIFLNKYEFRRDSVIIKCLKKFLFFQIKAIMSLKDIHIPILLCKYVFNLHL